MNKLKIGSRIKRSRILKTWKQIGYRVEFILLRLAIFVLRPMPPAIVRYWASQLFILIQFRKKVADNNLSMIFPDLSKEGRRSILREMYRNLGYTGVESFIMKPAKVYKKMGVEGWDKVENVLSEGKGVIIASGHLGNFEMAGRLMAHRNPLGVIVKKQHNPLFDKYANEQREKDKCTIIQEKNALRPVLRLLKKNGIVVIMTDQNARYRGYQLEFMGEKASTHISVAKIAIMTQTPIVMAGVYRNAAGYPLLKFTERIDVTSYEKNLNGYINLMQRILDAFGELVKENKEHWFWLHQRWRAPEKGKMGD